MRFLPFVLFNPTAWPRTETAEVELPFEQGDKVASGAAGDLEFHLVDAAGQVVACQ